MKAETSLEKARSGDPAIWIHLPEKVGLGEEGPLNGLTFAVKDNIDVAGMPTTAACPQYAYDPEEDAPVVAELRAAGAVPIGKTNLDQFATGLVGVRSPYGVPENPYSSAHIPGGSSSGSATTVARQQVDFALGTDTAGSGRVPAAFQNLVGLKPSRGLLSTRGVVPACKSLDCVSVFAHTIEVAGKVLDVVSHQDALDPWSRRDRDQLALSPTPTVGVLRGDQRDFSRMPEYAVCFDGAISRMSALGWKVVEVDVRAFMETAKLLYEGPWVSERSAAIEDFLKAQPDALHPVTRGIIEGGLDHSAVKTFKSMYRLAELRLQVDRIWQGIDVLLTPTVPAHYTLEEVAANPVETNSHLGLYTNWMNLLDLCAVAVPAGFTEAGLPFGITLQAPALRDHALLDLGATFMGESRSRVDAKKPGGVSVAVCGAHLEGFPLNGQLTERGSVLRKRTRSAPCYEFYALPGDIPKPGMVRVQEGGTSIEVEIWEMPVEHFGSFVDGIPSPLGIGTVQLEDGSGVKGFLCEPWAVADAENITSLGSWRAYMSRKAP